MKVQITQRTTGRHVGSCEMNLGCDLGSSTAGFVNEAWRCAVEDGDVDADARQAYEFKIAAE